MRCEECKNNGTYAIHVGQTTTLHKGVSYHFSLFHSSHHNDQGLKPEDLRRKLIAEGRDDDEFRRDSCNHFTLEHSIGTKAARLSVLEKGMMPTKGSVTGIPSKNWRTEEVDLTNVTILKYNFCLNLYLTGYVTNLTYISHVNTLLVILIFINC